MQYYNSYYTCIKQLARKNSLHTKYAIGINRSTIWRWKQESEEKYTGHELSNIENLQQFLEFKESGNIISSYLRITLVLSVLIRRTSEIRKYFNQNKETIVRTLLRYKQTMKLSFVIRILNIPSSVFYYWKNQVLYPCHFSSLQLCRKIYPNQLTERETTKLRSLLNSVQFKYWPVSSIAHYARRNRLLCISLSSWYNYIHKLGIMRPSLPKKQLNKTGIRAAETHQIWHADITIVRCLNGMKYYVYLLMDNYSRFILNYQIEEKVSAGIHLKSIRKACLDT